MTSGVTGRRRPYDETASVRQEQPPCSGTPTGTDAAAPANMERYGREPHGLRRGAVLKASLVAVAIATALVLAADVRALPPHPLTTGLADALWRYPDQNAVFARMRRAGMLAMEAVVSWPAIAPAEQPRDWRPGDPDDPHYDWRATDSVLRAIVAAGFQPIAVVASAPVWARIAPNFTSSAPKPEDFAAFIRAAAERYNGQNAGLPRVKYWRIWNEPNISHSFRPQVDPVTKQFVSPDIYRELVNQAAPAIHNAAATNLVIAGGTAPFSDNNADVRAIDSAWGPLKFMRRLLCVDDEGRATCGTRVAFDIWSTHPYTTGGPTHHAQLPYDVSLGDLPKMRATLDAGVRARHVASTGRVRFWVTEFSWDSNAPDPCAVPTALLKRWVSEALFRMWANGIEHVSWFKLMDEPVRTSLYQSGLFFQAADVGVAKPKPFFEGFRFPFVALQQGSRVFVWARTPGGRRALITIQRTFKGGWTAIKTLRTDRYGIVQAVLGTRPAGTFRAQLPSGERSLPFSIKAPPDHFYLPFGATVLSPQRSDCIF